MKKQRKTNWKAIAEAYRAELDRAINKLRERDLETVLREIISDEINRSL